MSLWVLLIVFVIFLLVLNKFYPSNYRNYLRFIPGPPKAFLVGNMFNIKRDPAERTAQLQEWYRQYGSPLNLKFAGLSRIHLSKASDVEILLKSSNNISKAADYNLFQPWLGDGLLLSSGAKWHQRRKMLTPSFHFQILKEFVPTFNQNSLTLIDILSNKITDSPNESFDICPYLTRCTLDIICETAMGKRVNAQIQTDSEYVTAIFRFGHSLMYRGIRPWLWPDFVFNNTKMGKQTVEALSTMHSFTRSVIAERISASIIGAETDTTEADEFGRKKRHAFLDLLITQMRQTGELTMKDITEEVDTFMFGGHDTTATGLAWATWFIGKYRAMQDQLREEIESVIGATKEITMEMVSQLHFLERFLKGQHVNDSPNQQYRIGLFKIVFKETQRILPSVPLIGRKITEQIQIGNYTIPVGTTVNINILGLHRNPQYFPDPLKFDPDRFLSENVEGRSPFAFVPFSGGLRNCIGQKFALLEEKIIICHLIRSFHIESVQRFEDLAPCTEMVLRPSKGIIVKLIKRD